MRSGFAEICRVVCGQQGWQLLPTGVLVETGDGRRQLVALEIFEFEQESLVRLYSVIGSSSSMTRQELEIALQSNADLAHGALAIRDGELMLVDTLTLEGLAPHALADAIEFISKSADDTERVVYGTDEH